MPLALILPSGDLILCYCMQPTWGLLIVKIFLARNALALNYDSSPRYDRSGPEPHSLDINYNNALPKEKYGDENAGNGGQACPFPTHGSGEKSSGRWQLLTLLGPSQNKYGGWPDGHCTSCALLKAQTYTLCASDQLRKARSSMFSNPKTFYSTNSQACFFFIYQNQILHRERYIE